MRIYVHGNCQAPALGDLIAEACGATVEVRARQVYSIDLDLEGQAYRDDVALADVILTQPVADGYRDTEILSTSWVRANARRDAKVFVFPVVYHRGLIPQCFTLAEFHSGRLAYHDAHAVDHFLRGESWETFIANSSRSDFLPAPFVRSELAGTTLELLRREWVGSVDIGVSDILASRLLTEQPLHTVNHPARPVLADIANRILERLGRDERARHDGLDMLDRFVMPPYLSVALALGHTGRGVWLDDMRFEGAIEKRPDFFKAVFDSYAAIGKAALLDAVRTNTEMTAYLARYREAVGQPEGPDLADFPGALYEVFFGRKASTDEKLHHLQTLRQEGFKAVISSFPRSGEFLASGGGAGLQERFDRNDTMPVTIPNIRIPHPVAAKPAKRTTLRSRMRQAYGVLLGRSEADVAQTGGDAAASAARAGGALQPVEAPMSVEEAGSHEPFSAPIDQVPSELCSTTDTAGIGPHPSDQSMLTADQPSEPASETSASEGGDLTGIGAGEDFQPALEALIEASIGDTAHPETLTIVVPMAGRGSRFANVGFTLPKPLIPVHGEPMIKVVIDNLAPSRPHRFIFICQKEHATTYNLVDLLSAWAPGCIVVQIEGVTEGAACTVLTAREHLGNGPLMIANSDQFIEVAIDDYLEAVGGLDGLIMTMSADDPKWSYAEIRADGLVSRVVEKEVISDQATVGIYNFASAADFLEAADRMIAADERVNGEFYVAPVYNQLIGRGSRIRVFNVGEVGNGMFGLGTPEDLAIFLARNAPERGAA